MATQFWIVRQGFLAAALAGQDHLCLYEDQTELQRIDMELERSFALGEVYSGDWRARRQDGSGMPIGTYMCTAGSNVS